MKRWISGFLFFGLITGAGAGLAAAGGLPDGLDGYELDGTSLSCVMTTRIKRTTALDDYNILFEMSGHKVYLNRLSNRCARLGFLDSFAYKTVGSRLCRGEIITVLHNGDAGSSCSLGSFELLKTTEE